MHMSYSLPTQGGNSGTWGTDLNNWLLQSHDANGNNISAKITEVTKGTGYTLATTDNSIRIVATSAITITIPTVGTLGNGFECEIVNLSGGSVTLDGPGSTNITMSANDVATVMEVNGTQLVAKGAATVIS